jgi:selenium-binding protein 1
MLDVSNPEVPVQTGIVDLGLNAGPHAIALTDDDRRLVVSDYFLNEDDFGKIHFEGDHHVHVVKVFKDHLESIRVLMSTLTRLSRVDRRVRTGSP